MSDIQRLLKTIEHGGKEEVWEAAKELESFTGNLVSSLIALLSARSASARAAAAYVLGFGRCGAARPDLEEVLNNPEEDNDVRGHAAEALGYIQDPRSVDVLIRNLEDDVSGVRYWCAFALGRIGDSRAISALTKMAETSGSDLYQTHPLRAEALDAIAEIRRQSGQTTLSGE